MQKIILILALVTGLTGAANAQRSIRKRSQGSSGTLSYGVKVGGTLSDLVGVNATDYESIYGVHAGGFLNITLNERLAFQPELLYSQKGADYTAVQPPFAPLGTTPRLHYADIPLAFHLTANGFFLEAGPQIGFLVYAKDKSSASTSTTYRDNLRTTDLGYVAGLGFERKTGLGFGFRYNGSFTEVRDANVVGSTTIQPHARNSAFQLYLTYSFNRAY
ncbi:porin family protein [Hymenobacter rubidus]|uniref:porin family protein n=1 Tax=Hymenobacter rubidus TaxID=1441626 RepID=UPI00191D3DAC|nr:porin family protein [Hymenobacter rubidus]